jgi:lysophospholipase L1-like esterase
MERSLMRRALICIFVVLTGCLDEREPVPTTGLVVFIGDSITYRWKLDEFLEGTVKSAVPGEHTSEMLARFDQDVLSLHPQLVVIHGGINDINSGNGPDIGNILAMVQRARAANVGVIVGTLLPVNGVPEQALVQETLQLFNAQVRMAADAYDYDVADYFAEITKLGNPPIPRAFADTVHPSRLGYAHMWKALQPALVRQGMIAE